MPHCSTVSCLRRNISSPLDADHENPGIIAPALWGKKEEYNRWNHRTYAVQHDECGRRHCIYGQDDLSSRPQKSSVYNNLVTDRLN